MTLIHDRLGPHGQKVPVDPSTMLDIPEECYEELANLRVYADELNNMRLELGRLMQVINNLTMECNRQENNAANSKKKIMDSMQLGPGNWAVDFESKKVAKVDDGSVKAPRVVGE